MNYSIIPLDEGLYDEGTGPPGQPRMGSYRIQTFQRVFPDRQGGFHDGIIVNRKALPHQFLWRAKE